MEDRIMFHAGRDDKRCGGNGMRGSPIKISFSIDHLHRCCYRDIHRYKVDQSVMLRLNLLNAVSAIAIIDRHLKRMITLRDKLRSSGIVHNWKPSDLYRATHRPTSTNSGRSDVFHSSSSSSSSSLYSSSSSSTWPNC